MVRTKETPGIETYYQTLQKIFQLQSEILTGVLPHYGERGSNDEDRFRDFLTKVLPKKFSVGTGFIVCSNPEISMSSQTDVVLYDEIQNSPLYKELSAFVYPAEMVYGTVEVKGLLQPKDLKKILEDIQKVRAFGPNRWYVRYKSAPKSPNRPDQPIVELEEFQFSKVPPHNFVFAYAQKWWSNFEKFESDLKEAIMETPAHIHGLVVLEEDWYLSQEAYSETGHEFQVSKDNALLHFINGLMHSIASVPMGQLSIDRYMKKQTRA